MGWDDVRIKACGLMAIVMTLLAAGRVDARQAAIPAPDQDYIVGPADVLLITSYDQPELTGKFTVEADGSIGYPYVGRITAGGATLRAVEALLKERLAAGGFFMNPELTVAIHTYHSQKIHVVGEVRTPGTYALSGDMRLVEALARAGSTLPTASGEVVIVHALDQPVRVDPAALGDRLDAGLDQVTRVDLRTLEIGERSQNVRLRHGDTVFVLRIESVYVFGHVANPGAYPMREKQLTVLQALSLAGGVTDRGAIGRVRIIRIVDGNKQEIKAKLTDLVLPRDTVVVPERFF